MEMPFRVVGLVRWAQGMTEVQICPRKVKIWGQMGGTINVQIPQPLPKLLWDFLLLFSFRIYHTIYSVSAAVESY